MYTGSGLSARTIRPRHRSRPKRRRTRSRAVSRWTSRSRSIASWPMPPGALRSASRRSERSAIDRSRLSRWPRTALVAGDQRRVGLGGEPVRKDKRAGSQGIHRISSESPGSGWPRRAAASRPPPPRRCGSAGHAAARALVCGARAVLSAADRDSVVGAAVSWAAPMPRAATRLAQYGWSAHWGTTTWGAPARVAVVVVPAPPWCTTAATRPNRACWLTSPMMKQSPASSTGTGRPSRGRRARGGPGRGSPRWPPGRCPPGRACCRSPRTPGRAGVQERLQFGRQRAFVGQDPRAGPHDVEVRRPRPGTEPGPPPATGGRRGGSRGRCPPAAGRSRPGEC